MNKIGVRLKNLITLLYIILASAILINAQEEKVKIPHKFEIVHSVKATSVKNQNNTGTCWAYATASFLESEILRLKNVEVDLSEMFFARKAYEEKAERYIRYHGRSNFSQGGQAHDVMLVIDKYGVMTQEAYPGNKIEKKYRHGETELVLRSMLDAVLKRRDKKLSPFWKEAFNKTLDVYIGEIPEKVIVNSVEHSPSSLRDDLGIDTENYIEFTSYARYPFYEQAILEIPDNWTHSRYFNIPIDDLMAIVDNSLENGYSICWDGDCGGDNFYRKECYAVIPEGEKEENPAEPEEEKEITQKYREELFENFDVTDDHLMHIVGLAENQNGTKFYYTKNSWGAEDRLFDGYWYMSESYMRLKTIAIMVHKDAIPEEIMKKLKID